MISMTKNRIRNVFPYDLQVVAKRHHVCLDARVFQQLREQVDTSNLDTPTIKMGLSDAYHQNNIGHVAPFTRCNAAFL
jgi:hypothetical protein